jgi:hypothetical protein
MAEIVLAMALPHSPTLRTPPERWNKDGDRDRSNIREMWFKKTLYRYPDLLKLRQGDGFDKLITLEEIQKRFDRCQIALEKLQEAFKDANVDTAVILGKDQQEIFIDISPTLTVYTGEEIYNGPPQRDVYAPPAWTVHQNDQELAQYLVRSLQKADFDLMDMTKWPPNTWVQGTQVTPHAFGFVLHDIMKDNPPPSVPILINTFFPPTQPSMPRAIRFGKVLTEAIRSWDSKKRVAVIASGGLSHFVVDEEQDQEFLELFRNFDLDGLASIDDRVYRSGTSEVKLFVSVLIAAQEMGYPMTLVDYVPCYRTEAGTGEGMGFMYWAPRDAGEV